MTLADFLRSQKDPHRLQNPASMMSASITTRGASGDKLNLCVTSLDASCIALLSTSSHLRLLVKAKTVLSSERSRSA
jgi:hypothetical protein